MNSYFALTATTAATLAGDYFIKVATNRGDLGYLHALTLGAFLYGASAVGWFVLMKSHTLAQISVIYSSANILLLAAMGALLFKEHVGVREFIGIFFALSSVVLMSVET